MKTNAEKVKELILLRRKLHGYSDFQKMINEELDKIYGGKQNENKI